MLNFLYGKKSLQPFFERLFYASLRGMNYGNGSDFKKSGEKYVFEILQKIGKELLIFDVGANRGDYSKSLISHLKNHPFKIYAFEPTKFCQEELKKIDYPNFELCKFGLSNQVGESTIHYDYDGSVWASLDNQDYGRHNKKLNLTETIQLETMDDFCKERNISYVDFIKIDVEGHEKEVLEGGVQMLSKNAVHLIQFEFGLASLYSKTRLMDIMKVLENYDIYRILPKGLRKITYNEAFEII